jgi:hypothetical protein
MRVSQATKSTKGSGLVWGSVIPLLAMIVALQPVYSQVAQHVEPTASAGAVRAGSGESMALDGDTLVVGAPDAAEQQGEAHVFTRVEGVWMKTMTLSAQDGAAFGSAVALDGHTLVVGAPSSDIDGKVTQGAAHVFTRNADVWVETAKLVASDGAAADQFGSVVAIEGDTIGVSAASANSHQGAAYVFSLSGDAWIETAKLAPSEAGPWRFGASLRLANDTLVVGAPGRLSASGQGSDRAYLFTRIGDSWTETAVVPAPDGAFRQDFPEGVTPQTEPGLPGGSLLPLPPASAHEEAGLDTRALASQSGVQALPCGALYDVTPGRRAISNRATVVDYPRTQWRRGYLESERKWLVWPALHNPDELGQLVWAETYTSSGWQACATRQYGGPNYRWTRGFWVPHGSNALYRICVTEPLIPSKVKTCTRPRSGGTMLP